jgi:hypothetical protein
MTMLGLFYADQLAKRSASTSGALTVTREAYFPVTQVFATIQLSRFGNEGTVQPQFAEAYIVSSETPMGEVAGISFPSRRDSVVYLRTGHLIYQLQVQHAFASAAFTIFDATPEATFQPAEVERELHVAVHDDDGYVVATHGAVRLRGGHDFDDHAIVEGALRTAQARSNRPLHAVTIDVSELPHGADFRIDTSSGTPVLDQ